jgi:hypothetical protein
VCKAGAGPDKVIPVYARGESKPKDPRQSAAPPRPSPQRPPSDAPRAGPHWQFHFGTFPGLFGMSFSSNQNMDVGENGIYLSLLKKALHAKYILILKTSNPAHLEQPNPLIAALLAGFGFLVLFNALFSFPFL